MQTKGFFYGLTHGQAGQGSKQSCSVRSTTWSRRSAPMSTGQRKLRAANWQLGLCKHSEQVGDASPQQYGSDRGSDRRNASAISCLMRCACRHRFLIEIKPAQTPDRRSPDETSPARLDMVRAVQKQRRRAELFYSVRPRSDRRSDPGCKSKRQLNRQCRSAKDHAETTAEPGALCRGANSGIAAQPATEICARYSSFVSIVFGPIQAGLRGGVGWLGGNTRTSAGALLTDPAELVTTTW